MKLWQKNIASLKEVEAFTVGKDRELDMYLAPFDVLGSLAHIQMLQTINLLTAEELKILQQGLKEIYKDIQSGTFLMEKEVEDIHSQVEIILTKKFGDTGKKIHSARSRNDQVLVDLKLYLRNEIEQLVNEVKDFFELLIQQSEKYKGPSDAGLYASSISNAIIIWTLVWRLC